MHFCDQVLLHPVDDISGTNQGEASQRNGRETEKVETKGHFWGWRERGGVVVLCDQV